MRPHVWKFLALASVLAATGAAGAQPAPPPAAIRYAEARRHELRSTVTLPGTVEVPRVSTVAAELAGVVEVMHAREGSRVSAGAVMVGLRTTALELQVASLEAEIREADARRELASREFDRATQLFERSILSGQQLEAARYELRAREGRSDQLRADLDRLRDSLSRSEIRAPFDGIVVRRFTEVGQWVTAGGPILEVQAVGEFEVAVDVPERYYGGLRQGQVATVSFDALPGRTLRARTVVIVPRATAQAGTFPIKLRLEGQGVGSVAAGMLATVALPLGASAPVTIVPKDAVTRDGAVQRVLIMTEDGTVRAADVTTGTQVGAWVAVTGDVQPGMRVLTRGNERVRVGQVVTGQAMAYALP
jgi:RND family efflux transporter MFP subunit